MKLLIDIGNSRIGFAIYEKDEIKNLFFLTTEKNKTADEISRLLSTYLKKEDNIDYILISSVVPSLNHPIEEALKYYFNVKPHFIGVGIKTGLSMKVDNPSEIGADLICDLVAAKEKYSYPTIIVDLGTASKLLILDNKGNFSGAIIAPGLLLSALSLFDNASLLPNIELKMPKKVVGKNTIDCMTSGIVYGHYSMILGLLNDIEKEYGYRFKKVLTGGNSYPFVDYFKEKGLIYDEKLVFDGLNIIAKKNVEVMK